MEATSGMRALKDLFGFPFRESNWGTKFLFGSLFFTGGFFLPFIPWIVLFGYAARVVRVNLANNGSPVLPEWDDWGALLVDGLKLFLVSFVLSLPGLLVILVGYGTYFGGFFTAISLQSFAGRDAVAPFMLLMLLSMGIMFLSMSVGSLLAMIAFFFIPPVSAHVVATGRLNGLLDIGGWWRNIWANPGGYLLVFFVWVGLWAVQYLIFYLMYMSIVLCMFTPLVVAPMAFYTIVVVAALTAQAYREAQEKGSRAHSDLQAAEDMLTA